MHFFREHFLFLIMLSKSSIKTKTLVVCVALNDGYTNQPLFVFRFLVLPFTLFHKIKYNVSKSLNVYMRFPLKY